MIYYAVGWVIYTLGRVIYALGRVIYALGWVIYALGRVIYALGWVIYAPYCCSSLFLFQIKSSCINVELKPGFGQVRPAFEEAIKYNSKCCVEVGRWSPGGRVSRPC